MDLAVLLYNYWLNAYSNFLESRSAVYGTVYGPVRTWINLSNAWRSMLKPHQALHKMAPSEWSPPLMAARCVCGKWQAPATLRRSVCKGRALGVWGRGFRYLGEGMCNKILVYFYHFLQRFGLKLTVQGKHTYRLIGSCIMELSTPGRVYSAWHTCKPVSCCKIP